LQLALEAHCFESAFKKCKIRIATSSGHRAQAFIAGKKKLKKTLRRPFFAKKSRLVTGNLQSLDRRKNVSQGLDKPKISIILLNRDKPILTRLAAVAAASSDLGVSFEILCVDNGSTAENLAILRQAEVGMRLLELPENKGFGEANNLAASEARGEFLLFLNNDAFLRPAAIRELLKAFLNMSDCGAAGAVLRWPDGRIQEAGCSLCEDGTAIRHGRDEPHFRTDSLRRFQPVDYVSGACLLIRRQVFLEIGGFDPVYSPAYYEDTDLCMRLRDKGKSVYLASRAECYHIENATSHTLESAEWATRQSEKNRLIFLQRWGKRLNHRFTR
jgi:GT2 family glycosyltransferase